MDIRALEVRRAVGAHARRGGPERHEQPGRRPGRPDRPLQDLLLLRRAMYRDAAEAVVAAHDDHRGPGAGSGHGGDALHRLQRGGRHRVIDDGDAPSMLVGREAVGDGLHPRYAPRDQSSVDSEGQGRRRSGGERAPSGTGRQWRRHPDLPMAVTQNHGVVAGEGPEPAGVRIPEPPRCGGHRSDALESLGVVGGQHHGV